MNTEINFLTKQPKKYVAPLVLVIVFVVLMVCIAAVLLFQKDQYAEKIDNQQTKRDQFATALKKHHEQVADEQQLQEMEQNSSTIQSESTPNVALYSHILGLLPSSNQFIHYENKANQLVIEAKFATLDDTAAYVSTLLKQTFIQDTQLTNVQKVESAYQATLTTTFDKELLIEELDSDE
ncbi:hypothetical protein [Lentibacillus sp. Marseille-P4043]|uniref:hypothetical protein n=1 Tax=Lentibacillus sp. Marseille-P4043 TaxID=2040293 RepID=UPI000D0B1B41|nr:hypothetical protein [Lentibacillus sp. Marseille-P4043]